MMEALRSGAEHALLAAQCLRRPLPVLLPSDGANAPPDFGLPDKQGSLRLIALGDIALLPGGKPDGDGWASLLEPLSGVMSRAHLRIANLESVLTTATTPAGSIGSFLRAEPDAVQALAAAQVDVVTCANNHCLDFGADALAESIAVLAGAGIESCGVGLEESGNSSVVVRRNGVSVAVLGFCDDHYVAPESPAGLGPTVVHDDQQMLRAVSAARKSAEVVVVNVHWGYEWALHPMLSQRDRARALVDAGATVVLCHHAHVPMAMETYGNSVIAHGLGNCAFPWRKTVAHPWRNCSYALEVGIDGGKVVSATAVPIHIRSDHRVAPSAGRQRVTMLGALRRLRTRLNDDAWLGQVEQSRLSREAVGAVRSLQAAQVRSESEFAERCAWLRTPRQQRLLKYVGSRGSSLAAVTGVLERLATAHLSAAELGAEGRALQQLDAVKIASSLGASGSRRVQFMERVP